MFPILEIKSRIDEEWNDKNTHRIIIVGANGVGKTSLVTLFTGKEMNTLSQPTTKYSNAQIQKENEVGEQKIKHFKAKICLTTASPGSDFQIVNFEALVLRESEVVGIFDDEPKESQLTEYDGCLCVFDLSRKDTFEACTKFRSNILRDKVYSVLSYYLS